MLKMCKCYQGVEKQSLCREGAVAQYVPGMTQDMLLTYNLESQMDPMQNLALILRLKATHPKMYVDAC